MSKTNRSSRPDDEDLSFWRSVKKAPPMEEDGDVDGPAGEGWDGEDWDDDEPEWWERKTFEEEPQKEW